MNDRKLYELTRSSSFLWKSSLVAILAFVALASILWAIKPDDDEISYDDLYLYSADGTSEFAINTEKYAKIVNDELRQETAFEEKLHALKYLLSIPTSPAAFQLPEFESISGITKGEYEILRAFSTAMQNPKGNGPESLSNMAQAKPAPQYTNYAFSLFYSTYSEISKAIDAAKAEISIHPTDRARILLIDIYARYEIHEEIKILQDAPDFGPLIDPFLKRNIALETMDWPVLLATLLPIAYQGTPLSMILLVLVSGAAWTFLLLRFNGKVSWATPVARLAIPALLLGALSAHLTILAVYYQESQLGLSTGNTLLSQAIYCVAGIGLREELLKLLCFIPLLPFLLKRRNELEILIVASLVGLGFAIEENISYFENSQGVAAFARFVTANFLHLSLTGLCGLTLAQAFMYRGSSINTAVSTFGLAVLAHGAYDAFIIVPELAEYSVGTFIVFILISYQFFMWLRHLRVKWNDPVSISAQFTLSLIIVFGSSYLLLSWDMGPIEGLMHLGEDAVTLGILLFMFYREIPEEIV